LVFNVKHCCHPCGMEPSPTKLLEEAMELRVLLAAHKCRGARIDL